MFLIDRYRRVEKVNGDVLSRTATELRTVDKMVETARDLISSTASAISRTSTESCGRTYVRF